MPDPYPILQLPKDAPEDTEQMGSKEKFWYRQGDERWLFKYPREGTGEHWAEKVVAEIAGLLHIPAARVELAVYDGHRGSATQSFADRATGRALIHGNEILAALVKGYDKRKWHHQSEHTLPRIINAVQALFPHEEEKAALERLAGYVLLDALVGNVDRHHENWGVLVLLTGNMNPDLEVAPTFDHASSLGRELTAERCRMILNTPGGVSKYMKKGHGGIFLKATDPRGASPLSLALEARRKYPEYFAPWIGGLAGLDMQQIEGIIGSIPEDWMPKESREFALAFVQTARHLLLEESK